MGPKHRGGDDGDQQVTPIGAAMQWVGRIFAAGLMMVLPGLAGQWIDGKLGTSFIVLLGFIVGLSTSLYYLILVTRQKP
jgi:hypothetical protein